MKTTLTLAVLALSLGASAQCRFASGSCRGGSNKSFELSGGYTALTPTGALAGHMNTVNAVGLRGTLLAPCNRFGVGFEMTTGSQPAVTQTQYFGLRSSELTPNDVTYTSNVTTVSATLRYTAIRGRYFDVFAGVKGGLANFSSGITIEDELSTLVDPYGCGPMPNQNVASRTDNTWQAGLTAGASLDIKALVKSLPSNTFVLQGHIGAIHGGDVAHIMAPSASADAHSHHANTTVTDGVPVNMQFMDWNTNQSHAHEVAREYTTPIRFFEAGVSLAVRF
jgi:hypothetical protein